MSQITDAVNQFSEKLRRFKGAGGGGISVEPSGISVLERQIREREDSLRNSVTASYRIYKSPFEALGKNSPRAAAVDRDEQNLLKAYELFRAVTEAEAAHKDEQTFLKAAEIVSPLSQRECYAEGGQLVYLAAWLYFEQNRRDYVPFFPQRQTGRPLTFVRAEDFRPEARDREILEIIAESFYSQGISRPAP